MTDSDLNIDANKIIGSVSQCSVLRLMTDQHVSPLLIGAYVNSIMYTLEGIAVIQYYLATKHNQDSLLFQVMVYFTFVVDTVSTCVTCVFVYLVCNQNQIIIFSDLILMHGPIFCSIPSHIGVRSFHFPFFILADGVSMSLLYYRRPHQYANLANSCHNCTKRHYWEHCTMFLNLSLLEDVSHFCFHQNICHSKHTLPRSQNYYITSVLILFMLAAVCQSNSEFTMCTDTNYALAVWELHGSITSLFSSIH
jgi:hypothetical protein